MKEIINMTPHEINLFLENGEEHKFPSKGSIRLSSSTVQDGSIGNIPLTKTVFGKASNLPKERDDRYYIVSALLCRKYPNRKDFLMVAQSVRGPKGKIIGVKSLTINPF